MVKWRLELDILVTRFLLNTISFGIGLRLRVGILLNRFRGFTRTDCGRTRADNRRADKGACYSNH